MDAHKEDTFEKMHGRIREQLFTQKSYARSRDTAIAFAEMEVLNHILAGGLEKNGENMFVLFWSIIQIYYVHSFPSLLKFSYWKFILIKYLSQMWAFWNQHYILF